MKTKILVTMILLAFGLSGWGQEIDSVGIQSKVDSLSKKIDVLEIEWEKGNEKSGRVINFGAKTLKEKQAQLKSELDSLKEVRIGLLESLKVRTDTVFIGKSDSSALVAKVKEELKSDLISLNYKKRFKGTQWKPYLRRDKDKGEFFIVVPFPEEEPGQEYTEEEDKRFFVKRDTFPLKEILQNMQAHENSVGDLSLKCFTTKDGIETLFIFGSEKIGQKTIITEINTWAGFPGQQCYCDIAPWAVQTISPLVIRRLKEMKENGLVTKTANKEVQKKLLWLKKKLKPTPKPIFD